MAKARQKQKAKTKAKIAEPKKIAHPDAKPPVDNAAQIAVHWKEEEYFQPSAKFIGQANLNDPAMVERFSEKHFPECFREYADLLDWDTYWHTTLDTNHPPFWKWFVGGKLNACYNCVDRHLTKYKNKAALIFVPEPEEEAATVVTYQELYRRVNEVAALLRDFAGLKTGDRVTIHMPMIPELPITMLACARLGIVHSVVFGGFSGEACGLRAADSGSRVLIYADGYYRNGKWIDHKGNADIAVATAEKEGQSIDKVLVWKRYPGKYMSDAPMIMGRDFFVDEILKDFRHAIVEPISMDAEAPLFLMYTSGTTGKPKGCQHRTGGYLAYATGTSKFYQDIHPTDVYWCMADIGWITGHSYIVYGPMALAATSVLYEGSPAIPGCRPPVAHRRTAGRKYFSHLAHRDSHAAQSRRRRARKIQLPLQAHDHRRRADRAGSLEVVLQRGGQRRSGHCRYLVADRDRRILVYHQACAGRYEARQRWACRTGNLSGHLGRK